MRNILKALLPLLFSFPSFGQVKTSCNCEGLVDPIYKGVIMLYDEPGGKIVKKLEQDTTNEDYLIFIIDKEEGNYFHLKFTYSISRRSFTGWITKLQYLGTYVRNYKDSVLLYSEPRLKSRVNSIIPEWDNSLYQVIHCSDKWMYVKKMYKGQAKEGWLAPYMQCSNPYTTCN